MRNYGIWLDRRESRRVRPGFPDMTVWLVAATLLVSGSAFADEKPAAKKTGPSRVVEAPTWEPPARKTTKVPGIGGVDAAGIVIETDPGGDARPWPYGAWIKTPDTGDDNVLELGTDRLPGLPRSGRIVTSCTRSTC